MISIFEQLDSILKTVNEAEEIPEEKTEKVVKPIPVSPDMETTEQGLQTAWEKFAKYFYNLSARGGGDSGSSMSMDSKVDLPDDFLSPELKGKISGKPQDKEFKKNRALWDADEELEKLKKEVEIDTSGSDDEFDDFDYQQNEFGDDDADTSDLDTSEMDPSSGSGSGDSDKSEEEKLQDEIGKAIDKMRQDKNSGKSGGKSGGTESSDGGGEESGGESGSESGSGSMDGDGSGGKQTESGRRGPGTTGKPMSAKDKKLTDLKNALEKGDSEGFEKASEELKEGETGSGSLAGEHKTNVSDDAFKEDMENSGFSEEDIEKMTKTKNEDTTKEYTEEEMEKIKREVVDGLEKKCKKRGGSALAKTVVKSAMRSKIENTEWKEMLKVFLKSKSVMKGDMSKVKNRTVYGNKNHLWRGAVLPTKSYGHGQIQKIYCFVDFSGSVEKDLVFTFLGRVIDLCQELSYTDVIVYGFGEHIVLPRKINSKMLKLDGKDVVLSQTWDFIDKQEPGGGFENFEDVAETIMEIRRKERDAVYLIFGDAIWSSYGNSKPPIYLKTICGEKILDNVCALTYYYGKPNGMFAGEIAYLKELVGLKHVITTKAEEIHT